VCYKQPIAFTVTFKKSLKRNSMVKAMDISKNALLKSELKAKYANLTDAELNQINNSFDQFVESISLKTHQQKENVAREVETSVDYAKSKTI
jgi:ubiquinone/menaquinone biosynthesis C-methylase UbiE